MKRLAMVLIAGLFFPSFAQAQFNVILTEGGSVGATADINALSSRPTISSNGQFIGLEADLTSGTTDDAAVLINLQSGLVTLLAQEGVTAVPGSGGVLFDGIDPIIEVNNSGQALFAADTEFATNPETLNFFDGTTLSTIIRQGDPAPAGAPDVEYGGDFAGLQLSNSGTLAGNFNAGPTTVLNEFLQIGPDIILAANTTPVAGYTETNPGSVNNVFSEFELSPDGTQFISEVTTNDDALVNGYFVVNGNFIAQEETTIHTSPIGTLLTFDGLNDSDIADSGDWIAEAVTIGGTADYTLVNGVAVEVEGEIAPDGSLFSTLSGVSINANGDYVTAWDTDALGANDDILLLNSETILVSEGDILNIDFDGDGVFEDVLVAGLGVEEFDLADDGTLALILNFDDLNGVELGDALVTFNINAISVPEPTTFGIMGLLGVAALGRRRR